MINNQNLEEVKRFLKKEPNPRIVMAQNDNFNRKILEYGKFDILLSVEKGERKDKIRQEDSGLNHVLAKIAVKNNIAIGIELEEISKLEPKEKASRLVKIIQNIIICRKSRTKIAIKNKSIQAAKDFLLGLGASTSQIEETIVF
ncbi:hypothetical protein FJZ21_01020 [Candidatus Pacearchaeota archaeon]|nr:hypothetical protein [Candidatus Pacearchaeota archaeon]